MHVVFLVQRFPGYGGAEEYVRELTLRLSDDGVNCTILTSNLDKRNILELPESIKVVKLPVLLKIGEYALWKGLLKTLLRSRADVFHVNTYGYFHTDMLSLARGLKKFKVVLTGHGFHGLDMFFHLCRNDIKEVSFLMNCRYVSRPFYDFVLGRNEIKSADALVALSQKDVEVYRWLGAEEGKIYEIPQGVRDVFFEDVDKTNVMSIREQLNGDPIILSVGELSGIKGKDIPLRALALLVKEYPRARLVYIGRDGGKCKFLKELVAHYGLKENVFFLGYVPSDQLINYYNSADVLVHTSYAEGLSTIILEAMAAGLPVVSTPAGGNAYLLQNSNAGVVVPFGNATSVFAAVDKIMKDNQFRALLALNGRTYASKNFRWNEIVEKHKELYQHVLGYSD